MMGGRQVIQDALFYEFCLEKERPLPTCRRRHVGRSIAFEDSSPVPSKECRARVSRQRGHPANRGDTCSRGSRNDRNTGGRATRSRPPSARVCGWVVTRLWVTTCNSASW